MSAGRVVYVDESTLKPGCVILQAVLGGDRELLDKHFDSSDWEVGSIDTMRAVPEYLLVKAAEIREEIRSAT